MSLKKVINDIPNERQDVIKKIGERTCTSRNAVYRWINGSVTPPPLKQKIIAEILGKDVEELFNN